MLKKIKKAISKHGILKVANDLGYRSHATIFYWIKINKIPNLAKEKVKQYLKGLES